MTRRLSIEAQASRLARYLEERPGAALPDGVDPEVLEALWVIRPDLAPAPRVTVEEILSGVTAGPFASEGVPLTLRPRTEAPRARVRPRFVAWGSGIGALAVAALALVVVRPHLPRDIPESALPPPPSPVAEAPAPPADEALEAPAAPQTVPASTQAPPLRPAERTIPEVLPAAPAPIGEAPRALPIPEVPAPGDESIEARGGLSAGFAESIEKGEGLGRSAQASAPSAAPVESALRVPAASDEGVYGWPHDAASPAPAERLRANAAEMPPDADDAVEGLAPLLARLEDPDPTVAQDAALRAARLQLEAGLPTAALVTVDRGLARDVRATALRARLLALRGAILAALGRHDEAAEAYRAAEAVEPP
ncbi:MAG: hypothetical protein JXB39_16820 [Deltaproteobacteria bacterium]|nr:hypothetical protein [Deltaproteobacteria bacterium]